MTRLGERVRERLPQAAGAVFLLLVAACGSAFQQSPPLESNAGATGTAGTAGTAETAETAGTAETAETAGTAGTAGTGGAVVATASAQADLDQIVNAPVRGTTKFGFLNKQVSPTSYQTLFLAKLKPTYALTDKQRNFEGENYLVFANDMALLQAAKLSLDNDSAGFTVSNRENFLHVVVQNNRYVDPIFRRCVATCQILDCGCRPTYYDYATLGTPAGLGTYGHYDLLDARVLLSFDLVKEVKAGAYDAKEAIAKLHEKYPSLAPESGEPPAAPAPEAQPTGAAPENPQNPAPPADIPPQEPAKSD